MKKLIFIILWTGVFAVIGLVIAMIYWGILGKMGAESWNDSALIKAGMGSAIIFFGVPVLGFILGLFGVLPGTRRKKEKNNNAA